MREVTYYGTGNYGGNADYTNLFRLIRENPITPLGEAAFLNEEWVWEFDSGVMTRIIEQDCDLISEAEAKAHFARIAPPGKTWVP